MAGPGLPTSITPGVTTGHAAAHATMAQYLNLFDTLFLTPNVDGDVLTWDGSTTTANWETPSSLLPANAQTGTTYTLALSDVGKRVELSNAAAIALTVPPNASVAFPVDCVITLVQTGAGQVTVAGGAGVTVNAAPGLKLTDQWSTATLIKRATNTWLLTGRLSA